MDVAVDSLEVRFGDTSALVNLTAAFPLGSKVVIWGSAGAGKTTLLKVIAGLIRPTSGVVRWGETDVATLDADRKRAGQADIGMVFQSDALFDSLTVLENVMLPLRKRRVPEEEAHSRAMEALGRVGLTTAAQKSPEWLSGGMKKRCGVARAIVAKPTVLLADDPFAGLDPATERSIAELLMEVANDKTLIAVLPDPVDSLPLERTLHLVAGRHRPDAEHAE